MSELKDAKTIWVVRFDGFFAEDFTCDLVKVDVEGHELQALQGMERICTNSRRVKILFENMGVGQNRGQSIEFFLEKLNFNIYGVSGGATLVPLKKDELAQWNGYIFAGKVGDPDLGELNRRRFLSIPASCPSKPPQSKTRF